MASADTPSETLTKPSPQFPAAKLTAVARLKSFTGSIVPKREKPKPQFPPPSWNIADYHPSNSSPFSTPSQTPVSELPTPAANQPQPLPAPNGPTPVEEDVEPLTFAMRLRSMIDLLPIPGMGTSPSTTPATESHSVPQSSEPPTQPLPADMDPHLVKMLSSEELMNGDTGADGKGRKPSVWNVLAGLRRDGKDGAKGETTIPSPVEAEDAGGVMMYAPLEPKADSRLSLAEAEIIHETTPPKTEIGKAAEKLKDALHVSEPSPPAEKRVWVPSTTELSVLTAWWGYRLYLPPPVMAKLGSSSVKAAARAAMITSALKWMVDKIPMAVVPPQLKPAVSMLKTLAPIASYVGVFIAWSWDRIKTMDEGNGVVLTATWLLPVALLPMAWDAGPIYRPILFPDPEEIKRAEEAAKSSEENKSNKSNETGDGGGEPGKEKKKKSKLKFW